VTSTAAALPEPAPDVRTIADLPFHIMGRFAKPALVGRCRSNGISWFSSKEVFERIRDLSLGFSALGIAKGDRVALISESRPEWLFVDLAVLTAGGVLVPIYPTLSAGQIRYILDDSGARVAVVSSRLQLEKLQEIRHQLPALEAIVAMDPPSLGMGNQPPSSGGQAPPSLGAGSQPDSPSHLGLEAVAERGHARMTGEWGVGREFRDATRRVTPEDLATIVYTSGTTGEPKGVMLTHGNLTANLYAGAKALDVRQDDVALSFLPLSHAFERMVSYIYLLCGVTIAFAESFDTIGRDIAAVKPTVITGVPRVYEKLHDRIMEKGQAAAGAKAAIFRWAMGVGRARGRAILRGSQPDPLTSLQATLAERLVFAKIREGVGGRIRYLVSGSAPLSGSLAEFFYGVGLRVIEGYGLTETAPILSVNPPEAPRVGTVGKAVEGVDLRIAADGEILARGPNVMTGYYRKPEATAAVLKDGWFHTGDGGTIDGDGYLTITDRKKDLLVTSGGKKVAPQPIEEVLKRSPLINEAVILGDRRKYIAALIVPNFKALERRLQDLGRPPADLSGPSSRAKALERSDVLALYQEIIDALNRDLSQFERIKRFVLLPAEFSIDSGELTPTLKVKRKIVEERWKARIDELYAD
jgi:long-chain acyl-CoA synthetase